MNPQGWKNGAWGLPAIGVSFLPKVVCPVCSAAYVALLSSIGLGFLSSTKYLVVVTSMLLLVALGALFFGASDRRGRGPFVIGLIAAGWVIVGKFWIDSQAAMYIGVALLIYASVWSAVPRPKAM